MSELTDSYQLDDFQCRNIEDDLHGRCAACRGGSSTTTQQHWHSATHCSVRYHVLQRRQLGVQAGRMARFQAHRCGCNTGKCPKNRRQLTRSAKILAGGFLGMKEHNLAVGVEQLKFVNEPVRTASTATTTATSSANILGSTATSSKRWRQLAPEHVVLLGQGAIGRCPSSTPRSNLSGRSARTRKRHCQLTMSRFLCRGVEEHIISCGVR
jgi:hypothetical protein